MSEKKRFLGLKKFRERKELRQNQLAKILSVTNATYNNWETGKRDPSFIVVQKLFEMGATVEELFGVDYSKTASPASSSEELLRKMRQMEEDIAELKGVKKAMAGVG